MCGYAEGEIQNDLIEERTARITADGAFTLTLDAAITRIGDAEAAIITERETRIADGVVFAANAGYALPAGGRAVFSAATGAKFYTSGVTVERKTWTPTVTFATPGDFAPTYALQEGEYWHSGDYVHVRFRVTFTANAYTTAAGAFRLILPVSYAGAGMGVPLSRVFNVDIPAGTFGEPKGYVASAGGPTFLEFLINRPANAPIFLGSNFVPPSRASVSIEGQFFYRAA
ncbi:hypothetical protein [Methylobacterium sp. B4]|uniref:hypothetical protein n=1 Tax=Methylobacterium sp. B4 TaxID=1938755 RepID=UPI000D75C9E4|nr:hypothetical protein [Methylobacterium sp. B4]PXW50728.1 hypothetical protein BY998_14024 [Methylobacterium sp. B4]